MIYLRLFILFLIGLSVAQGRHFSTVVIDAGHGGGDKGASWGGVHESHLNLIVANKLAYELKHRGVKVVMTRSRDRRTSFAKRIATANRYPNSVFVSIHFNACRDTSAKGLETFYLSSDGKKMASLVQSQLVKGLRGRNRGVKTANLKVLRDTKSPSILVEGGFISNPRERRRCSTREYQTTAARVIADGLMQYRRMR